MVEMLRERAIEIRDRLQEGDPQRRIIDAHIALLDVEGALLDGRAERLNLRDCFSAEEKRALKEDGAVVYKLDGRTILEQETARERAGRPAFWYVVSAPDNLLGSPSRKIEVAIYPDPGKFFVPDSFGKDTDTQERLVKADAEVLRQRTGLQEVTQIITDEAATLTGLVFQHEAATGVWLFGPEYAKAVGKDWVYGRTKDPTNIGGSGVAGVGCAGSGHGVSVSDWLRAVGGDGVGSPRLVVPLANR